MKSIIAIDPGASGGIAFRDREGTVTVTKMPETVRDLWDFLIDTKDGDTVAVIENVGFHMPGNNASASVKFGKHVGHLEMALTALGVPWEKVTPHKWMKHVLGTVPKDKKARKKAIKEAMQRTYPDLDVYLWGADALGILTWAIRAHE